MTIVFYVDTIQLILLQFSHYLTLVTLFATTANAYQQHVTKKQLHRITGKNRSREKTPDHMPAHVKHIKFTIGITDVDRKKGRQVPRSCYFEEDAILVIDEVQGGGRTDISSPYDIR